MMTAAVVWCTRLGWSFIAALNAGCLVPLFPPSSTFTVNKVSLSTTSRAAKRCWDTLLVEAWQVPTKKECLYNSHSQKRHTRFQVLGSKDIQRIFFSTWSWQATAGDSKPDIQNQIPHAHRIEKVGNGGDRGGWRMEEAKWAVEGCWSEWNRKIRKSWSYLLRKRSEFRSSNFVRERTEPRRNAEMLMSTLVLDLSHSMSSLLKSTKVQSFHATFGFFWLSQCMGQHTLIQDRSVILFFGSLQASQTICLHVMTTLWEFLRMDIGPTMMDWSEKETPFTKKFFGVDKFRCKFTDVDFQQK